MIEGPFHDDHLIAGYTLIDVASREEAMDWSSATRRPLEEEDGEIEVRRLFDLDEFVQGPPFRGSGSSIWSAGSLPTWGGPA